MSHNSKYTGAEVESLLDGIGKTIVVEHEATDTEVELTPNVLHKWGVVTSLILTFPQDAEGYANEYKVVFIAGEGFSLSVPLVMRWANDEIPKFEVGKQYEMSVFDKRILVSAFATPFIEGEFLQYVENDGVDYVLTDIYMSSDMFGMRCRWSVMFSSGQTANYAVAGTRQESGVESATAFFLWALSGTQGRMLYWNGSRKTSFGQFVEGTIYEDEWTNEQNNVSSAYPLMVFGGNNVGKNQYNNKYRVYHMQFLGSDGNPLYDLRPFRRASDDAVGLIDVVNNFFYPSVNGNLRGV